MNRRFHVLILMTSSLALLLLITSLTHSFFEQLPITGTFAPSDDVNVAVDVNARNFVGTGGYTPLMMAAVNGDLEYAQELIAQGADLDALSANQDRDTGLNIALINVNNGLSSDRIYRIAKLIIESGANLRIKNARGEEAIHAPLMRILPLDRRKELLKMLLDRGAFINARNNRGETILHISISVWSTDWIKYLVDEYGQLLQYDAVATIPRWFSDPLDKSVLPHKYTPMEYADETGHIGAGLLGDVLKNRPRYLGDDGDVKATDVHGRNGLMLAILRDDPKFVTALLKVGTDVTVVDDQGNSVLHYAVISNQPLRYVQQLLQAGAPVNVANAQGDTPLMRLRYQWLIDKRVPVAKLLYAAGARLDVKNSEGKNFVQLVAALKDPALLSWTQKVIGELALSAKK